MTSDDFKRVQQKFQELFFQEDPIPTWCLFDIIGGLEGIKPVSQMAARQSDLAKLQELGTITGTHIVGSSFQLRAKSRTLEGRLIFEAASVTDPDSEYIFIYISKDRTKIDEVIRIDAQADEEKSIADHIKSGGLFGYPACCIDSYVISLHLDPLHAQLENTSIAEDYYFYNNRFSSLFNQYNLIAEMYPCSFACKKSAEFAHALFEGTQKYLPDFLSEVTTLIKRPILIIEQFAFQFLSYSVDLDFFRYNPGEVSAAGIPPDIAEIVRGNNKIQFGGDHLVFYRDDVRTTEIPTKKNPVKEKGARLFVFNADLDDEFAANGLLTH